MLSTIIFVVVTLFAVASIYTSNILKAMLGLAFIVLILAFAFNLSTEAGLVVIGVLTSCLGLTLYGDCSTNSRHKCEVLENDHQREKMRKKVQARWDEDDRISEEKLAA